MPRDKFAAMASRAKITMPSEQGDASQTDPQKQQSSETPTPPPKRDKLAALAARKNSGSSAPTTAPASDATTLKASPPKRDKMAALATRSRTPPPVATASTSPPKRDKMAALAARSLTPPPTAESNTNSENKTDGASVPPPRRNKLAALASRNNKLAKMGEATASPKAPDPLVETKSREELAAEAALVREKHVSALKERLSKRKGILQRLDRAEELTCQLLKIAAQTTDALQDLNFAAPNLSQLSAAYRSTLQELHPLLTDGTEELIKPYQNHADDTKQSMYAARVEMRLAKERMDVLKLFTDLEKAERNEETRSAQNTEMTKDSSRTEGDDNDRKRKR